MILLLVMKPAVLGTCKMLAPDLRLPVHTFVPVVHTVHLKKKGLLKWLTST